MCIEFRKRALSLILAVVMAIGIGTSPMASADAAVTNKGDPWKTGVKWPALTGKASALAPDDVKFTHKEYTGQTYEDVSGKFVRASDVFAINREEAHTNATVPYDSVESAVNGAENYQKDSSAYIQMLTGDNNNWDLTVVQNAAQGQKFLDDGFMNPNYKKDPSDGWKSVALPASWTSYGFDFPIYTNVQMPWQSKYDTNVTVPNAPVNYNPVGFYIKKFKLEDTMLQENGRIFISFQGVESNYYVYVNGHEVGYSEDSYMAHEFDITDYLNPKGQENTLAVEVHKFCDGTWLEDQDMIYDGGIFRDVYLESTPLVHINDYRVITDLDDTYTDANLKLSTSVKNYSTGNVSNFGIDVKLFDEDGENLFENSPLRFDVSQIGSGKTADDSVSRLVKNPKLWSAEHPNLYTLVLSLYDKTTGKYFESTSQELGFREIGFTRSTVDANYKNTTSGVYKNITINGKPLLFKGVNRHDSDPFYGKHVTKEAFIQDVTVMKKYNINAIRTSHYGNDEYLYYLCDKYGLYMMGETNLECHALAGSADSRNTMARHFTNLCLDRTATSFNTLKNRTAIVMWSIGNEMGYTVTDGNNIFPKMIWYFKDRDTTRPVHSEGQESEGGVDVNSNMYPSVETVQGRAKTANQMPYVLCEYNHAMGNAVGNMNEYWNAIRSSTNMMGGFIWDWVEQSRAISFDKLPDQFTITEKSKNAAVATMYGDGKVADATDDSLSSKSYSGYTLMPDDKNDFYNSVISGGDKAFTCEVVVKPASESSNSVFISKGDTQVALKTGSSSKGIEFFIYDGTNWNAASTSSFPSDWVGNWHQIVGTYEKTVGLKLYCDGTLLATKAGTYSAKSTSNNLGVGYDVSNGRKIDGAISLARVYSKALTLNEIKAQRNTNPQIKENDSSVVTWLDYSADVTKAPKDAWDYYATDESHQNLYKGEMDGHYYGYGGDWGDSPNDNDFCVNGLVSPDRDPQPELEQVKYEYQNFWIKASDNDIFNRKIKVYNENNFANLNEYNLDWELVEDGKVIDKGTLDDANVAPKQTKSLTIPYTMPATEARKAGSEYYLNINVTLKEDTLWADAGYETAHKQFKVAATVPAVLPAISTNAVTIDQTSDVNDILVTGTDFSFKLNKKTGAMSNYIYKSEELISQGPVPNFWRAKNDNDKQMDGAWQSMNKNIAADSITVTTAGDGRKVITTDLTLNKTANAKETIVYTIDGSGAVTVNLKLDATKTSLGQIMKVGSTMTVPEGFENVNWYGLGAAETYSDRKDFAITGLFSNTVNELFYPFLLTQTSGNLSDVKWVSLTSDDKDTGILVAGKNLLETSAQHFTMDELDAAPHPYQLKAPHKETYFNVDYKSLGIGNNSCGDQALPAYRLLNDKTYSYEYTIIPYDKTTKDPMELSKPWRTIDSFDQAAYDKQQVASVQNEIDELYLYSYAQLDTINTYASDYNSLSDTQKSQITNYSKLEQALKDVQGLKNKTPYIADKSNNKLNPVLGSTAALKGDTTFGTSMTGHMAIPNTKGTSGGDIFSDVFKGKKPFTVETWVKPSSITSQNMIMGKGDSCFGFRADSSSLDFFYTAGGNKWPGVYQKAMPADWTNKWHQVAGIYDGSTLSFYLDGAIIGSGPDTGNGLITNTTNFNIGYDPETSRENTNEFATSRVYSKALTATELQAQAAYDKDSNKIPAYAPDNSNVVMWLDYRNLGYNAVETKDEIQKVSITPDTSKAPAEIIAGNSQEFTLVPDLAGAKITQATWTVLDRFGNKVKGVTVTPSKTDFSKASLNISKTVPAGTILRLTASNINANASFTAMATVVVVEPITKVVVTPSSTKVNKGSTQQFKASVYGATGSFSEDVQWAVNSSISTISSTGLLNIAANETAASLTVTATSTADITKSGTAVVTVTTASAHHSSGSSSSHDLKSVETNPSTITTTTNAAGGTVTAVTTKPDAAPIVTGNHSAVSVTVPTGITSIVSDATAKKPASIQIAAPTSEIVEQLKNNAVKTLDLIIKIPTLVANNTNANVKITINVDPSILQAAKNAQKDITLAVVNSDTGKEVYSWTFSGTNLKNSIASVVNVNLAMKVSPVKSDAAATAVVVNNTADKKAAGVVLKFENSGLLPSAAKVKVYVANQEGCTPNSKVFLYYLNTATKLLEQMPQCEYTVDANGYVTITISHCSDYVLLPKAATNPYPVKSDTSFPTGIKTGKSYTFAMTVNGNATPSFAVGNSKAFTSTVKRMGNKYYFTVKAVGTPGTMTAVYSTLSGQKPVVMSYISIVK